MLDRLLEHCRAEPDLYKWLARALDEYRAGMPLAAALGLDGPRAVRQRDAAIRRGADLVDPAGELSKWKRAEKVEKAIRYFRRVRNHDSPLALAIYEVIEIEANGVKSVRCQRAIFDRLN